MGKIVVLCLLVGAIMSIGACAVSTTRDSYGLYQTPSPLYVDWNAGTLAVLSIGLALMVIPLSYYFLRGREL
ncbi:MAG: hypothetical protein IH955_00205 [Chloroflexi bacterium]|nr:hypothetical protein [Chloroflexota bacterium]